MTTAAKDIKQHKPLPAPNSDFYEFAADLSAEELAIVKMLLVMLVIGLTCAGAGANPYQSQSKEGTESQSSKTIQVTTKDGR